MICFCFETVKEVKKLRHNKSVNTVSQKNVKWARPVNTTFRGGGHVHVVNIVKVSRFGQGLRRDSHGLVWQDTNPGLWHESPVFGPSKPPHLLHLQTLSRFKVLTDDKKCGADTKHFSSWNLLWKSCWVSRKTLTIRICPPKSGGATLCYTAIRVSWRGKQVYLFHYSPRKKKC